MHPDAEALLRRFAEIESSGDAGPTSVTRLSPTDGDVGHPRGAEGESLATREAHPTGWWDYRGGGFDPLPPWEASARPGRRS